MDEFATNPKLPYRSGGSLLNLEKFSGMRKVFLWIAWSTLKKRLAKLSDIDDRRAA